MTSIVEVLAEHHSQPDLIRRVHDAVAALGYVVEVNGEFKHGKWALTVTVPEASLRGLRVVKKLLADKPCPCGRGEMLKHVRTITNGDDAQIEVSL